MPSGAALGGLRVASTFRLPHLLHRSRFTKPTIGVPGVIAGATTPRRSTPRRVGNSGTRRSAPAQHATPAQTYLYDKKVVAAFPGPRPSASALELFTLFDTGQRCRWSFGAGFGSFVGLFGNGSQRPRVIRSTSA